MENVQISFFDTEPDVFQAADDRSELFEILKRGSGFENGCLRIYAAYMLLDSGRFESFLREEFGVGGHSVPGGFVDYGGSGIVIRYWNRDQDSAKADEKYSWRQVAKTYEIMIGMGIFPDAGVIGRYEEARKAGKGAPRPRMMYI